MVKIGVIYDFPIYLDKSVLFMEHIDEKLILGKYFYKLSSKAQQTLVDRNIVEIKKYNRSKMRLNVVYVEALKEMYNILKEEANEEDSDKQKEISDEYLALKKTLNKTILSR